MPATAIRRFAAFLMLAGAAAGLGSCRDQPEGSARVLVIGDQAPKLKDPAVAPLSAADAVLLSNVAQGLVSVDASGNIVAGLAERWNVSNDGLSYIFRLATAEWPGGGKITAQQVVRIIKRQLAARSKNPIKDTLGAVDDVVAMTDRVIEVRLLAPRPNLLPLLAAPEMAIIRNGQGAGPFTLDAEAAASGDLRLTREIVSLGDDEVRREEEVLLGTASAVDAVKAFAAGKADLVLGGTFADLPLARRIRLPRNSLRFDPALGLFGLLPASAEGPFSEPEVRRLLSQAVDRDALLAALDVPGLAGRATVLAPGVDALPGPAQPPWFAVPLAERRPGLLAEATRLFGPGEKPIIRIALPEGPGADILLARLAADWGALGFRVERPSSPRSADFRLVDAVAPSTSAAWFLRGFRCGVVPLCDEEVDTLLGAARAAPVPAQRYALLAQAAARIDEGQLFIPLAAPIRWSLVHGRIQGFAGNRYARHTLTDLELTSSAGGQ
jgi:peptide/nickel transport system substrate-binding protein